MCLIVRRTVHHLTHGTRHLSILQVPIGLGTNSQNSPRGPAYFSIQPPFPNAVERVR